MFFSIFGRLFGAALFYEEFCLDKNHGRRQPAEKNLKVGSKCQKMVSKGVFLKHFLASFWRRPLLWGILLKLEPWPATDGRKKFQGRLKIFKNGPKTVLLSIFGRLFGTALFYNGSCLNKNHGRGQPAEKNLKVGSKFQKNCLQNVVFKHFWATFWRRTLLWWILFK